MKNRKTKRSRGPISEGYEEQVWNFIQRVKFCKRLYLFIYSSREKKREWESRSRVERGEKGRKEEWERVLSRPCMEWESRYRVNPTTQRPRPERKPRARCLTYWDTQVPLRVSKGDTCLLASQKGHWESCEKWVRRGEPFGKKTFDMLRQCSMLNIDPQRYRS